MDDVSYIENILSFIPPFYRTRTKSKTWMILLLTKTKPLGLLRPYLEPRLVLLPSQVDQNIMTSI